MSQRVERGRRRRVRAGKCVLFIWKWHGAFSWVPDAYAIRLVRVYVPPSSLWACVCVLAMHSEFRCAVSEIPSGIFHLETTAPRPSLSHIVQCKQIGVLKKSFSAKTFNCSVCASTKRSTHTHTHRRRTAHCWLCWVDCQCYAECALQHRISITLRRTVARSHEKIFSLSTFFLSFAGLHRNFPNFPIPPPPPSVNDYAKNKRLEINDEIRLFCGWIVRRACSRSFSHFFFLGRSHFFEKTTPE